MKRILVMVFACVFLFSGVAYADLMDGLVAYYSFDGNANDSSGYNNHGTVYGAVLTTDRFGSPDSAYYFNGQNNNYIEAPHASYLEINDTISLSCWVNASEDNYWRVGLISKYTEYEPLKGYSLRLLHDKAQMDLLYQTPGTPPGWATNTSTTTSDVTDSTWHHIAATYDGSTIKMYLDGNLEDSEQIFLSWDLFLGPLLLGKTIYPYNDGDQNLPNVLIGSLDEVRIYNRALFESEIQELWGDYDGGSSGGGGSEPVPEPATMLLLGSGLIGLAGFRRKFRKG